MTASRPYLLDVTRLVALCWSGKHPTGIDRVCIAYLHHYRHNALAVVQHRGVFRIFDDQRSDLLFDLLCDPRRGFRSRLVSRAPKILAGGITKLEYRGQIYLNVGHTDFDLPSHRLWVQTCQLKPVYLIHDLIPIGNAAMCTPHATQRHLGRVVNALGAAAGIIVNSNATANDLARFAHSNGMRLPPVLAAHLAGQKFARMHPLSIPGLPHFVCIGTIEPRKNHLLLLRVWKRLSARLGSQAPGLVMVGQWGVNSGPVRQFLEENVELVRTVKVLDQCDDETVAGWLSRATAMLLPTLAEGFGLPVVEAMSLRVPVIASDLPSLREIGGGIPLLLDPGDELAWESAILRFMNDGEEARLQRQQLAIYRAPDWSDHFAQVDKWLVSAVRARQPWQEASRGTLIPSYGARNAGAPSLQMPEGAAQRAFLR